MNEERPFFFIFFFLDQDTHTDDDDDRDLVYLGRFINVQPLATHTQRDASRIDIIIKPDG